MTEQLPQPVTALRSPNELRRPDTRGHLRHIVVITNLDRPLAELDVDDILQINWEGAATAIRDAIVRIEHEGDLFSSTLQETMQLIALVLKRLEYEDAEYQKKLSDYPKPLFWERILFLLPGAAARRFRADQHIRRLAWKKSRALGAIRERIFDLRQELAEVVTLAVHRHLVIADDVYRRLSQELEVLNGRIRQCKDIIRELERYEWLEKYGEGSTERRQIKLRVKVYCHSLNSCDVSFKLKIPDDEKNLYTPNKILAFARRVLSELGVQGCPIEAQLVGLREQVIRKVYAETEPTSK